MQFRLQVTVSKPTMHPHTAYSFTAKLLDWSMVLQLGRSQSICDVGFQLFLSGF
jgi:hypothetical protein